MTWFGRAFVLGALAVLPLAALGEDAALVLVGDDYRELRDAGGTTEARDLAQMLSASGFRVVTSIDESNADVTRAVKDFRDLARGAERVFVLVSGHVVSTAREAWLLTRFAEDVSDINVGTQAVPLGALLDVASTKPGAALVMVAPSRRAPTGEGLTTGMTLEPPQGVTLATGDLDDLVDVARDVALVPGRSLALAAGDVELSGFVASSVPFLPVAPGEAGALPEIDREAAYWDVVKTMGSSAAYEAYLKAFPRGRFAAEAQTGLRGIVDNAEARAVGEEEALGLDREARRRVQRDLSLLGFDPRGIDGIFGPGSRSAITAWQRVNGFEANGYLTERQLSALGDAAAIRSAELEREAAARKAEEERRDAAYWRDTGQGSDEVGLRAYIERYPDGIYADVARARLDEIEAAKRAQAAAEERQLWDRVRGEDRPAGYRDYLNRYPNGSFAEEARARLEALTSEADNSGQIAEAKAEEALIAGNGVTRLLVETRLKTAGFDPGRVDGNFDETSRRAIRRFQRAQGLEVTGYVTQATMVRLLTVR